MKKIQLEMKIFNAQKVQKKKKKCKKNKIYFLT